MHHEAPEELERESSPQSRFLVVLALLGLTVVLMQIAHEHQTWVDPEKSSSMPLLFRSPGQ